MCLNGYSTSSLMNKSNIFVYIELSKLVSGLNANVLLAKNSLKLQASYFNIIPSKYFSEDLSPEWERILQQIKQHGPLLDEDGNVVMSAIANTIAQMSQQECVTIAMSIINLYEKVKLELD